MVQNSQFVVTIKNYPEEIGLEATESHQKNMLALMIRNAIGETIKDYVANRQGNVQRLAASIGEVTVEIPSDISYEVVGRVGMVTPRKELLESTADDQVPTNV